ncbi:MAG: response regulator [Elusimicrobia bacterium]|nr:response regulator [Elusimicrobiota bacterium]
MAKIRVLVVDDNINFLQLAQLALGTEEYEVITATDGQDGFDQARKEKPDIILMDVMMPRVSGLELIRMMLSDEEVRKIPILVMTASHFDPSTEGVFMQEPNVKGFLHKPCPVNILRDEIARALAA